MTVILMRKAFLVVCLLVLSSFVFTLECHSREKTVGKSISVYGAVKTSIKISLSDLRKMQPFHIKDVPLLKEKGDENQEEEALGAFNYQGVLLRDILEKTGMKYKRKWEPLVYVRVRGG